MAKDFVAAKLQEGKKKKKQKKHSPARKHNQEDASSI
jgi:hypothetical protein